MNKELNNLIDDILKEKLKLHYENEELEAQGKLIKELCKEIERLQKAREYDIKYNKYLQSELAKANNIINETRKYLTNNAIFDINDKGVNKTMLSMLRDDKE